MERKPRTERKAPTHTAQYLCRHMPEWIKVTLERYAQVRGLPAMEDAIYHIVERNAECRMLWKTLLEERRRAGIIEKAENEGGYAPPV